MWYRSKSRISIIFTFLALALAVFALAGCGDEDEPATSGATAAATSATGEQSGATGESGATEAESDDTPKDDGGVSPDGEDGGVGTEGGAGDEEPARAPIEITVTGGAFSQKTTDEVHVPTFMAIELDVTVRDEEDAKLRITRPGGKTFSRTFPGGKRTTYLTEGLRPGRSMTVTLGNRSIVVIADLVAGP